MSFLLERMHPQCYHLTGSPVLILCISW